MLGVRTGAGPGDGTQLYVGRPRPSPDQLRNAEPLLHRSLSGRQQEQRVEMSRQERKDLARARSNESSVALLSPKRRRQLTSDVTK